MTPPPGRPALPPWLWLYDGALVLAGLGWLPYYLLVRRPWHPGVVQRFGWYPPSVLAALQRPRPIWVHAVSVGEVLAALPLIAALRARAATGRRAGAATGRGPWVVSTTTPTGQQLARARLPADDVVLFAPWDLGGCVQRAVATIRPRLFVGLETELWPNLFLRLSAAGVPLAVVNGRLSERSFRRYLVVRRWLRAVLAPVRVWAMQTSADAQRVTALGVDPARVQVVGNLKADVAPPALGAAEQQALRQRLGVHGQALLWIAGSTHRGEEAVVLEAFRQVRLDAPALHLMLVPRHPERASEVASMVRQAGFHPRRWSQVTESRAPGEPWAPETILIVDTLGELSRLYAVADLVFVGGSLVPHGGHNLLEPAQLAKPIVTGPHTQNFESVAALLQEAGGLRVVGTPEALAGQIRRWAARPDQRREVGARAQAAVVQQQGSTARTVALLEAEVGAAVLDGL